MARNSASIDKWMAVEEKAFERGENADVTFVVDGQEIRANRGKLEMHSDVFKAMFANDYEKSGGRLEINDTTPDVFKKLIFACYCPSIKLNDCNHALELLKLAHQYNIGHVLIRCESYITANKSTLTANNVIQFYVAGDLFDSIGIKNAALEVLPTLNCCSKKLLGMDQLSADQLREVFNAVWPKTCSSDHPCDTCPSIVEHKKPRLDPFFWPPKYSFETASKSSFF